MPENWQVGGFGIYLHWPFCAAKCPYCDFNSHVTSSIDHDAWCEAYLNEIAKAASLTSDRILQSVYFGGGTPSLIAPKTIYEVLEAIFQAWTPANDIEVTLEANPTSVEAARFSEYARAGVNRISLGLQSLDDASLKRLGRLHTVSDGMRALEVAKTYFNRVSADLMYGLQDQTLSNWEEEINQALNWEIDHLSLYQLTIEPGTAFSDRFAANKLPGLPDDDMGADFFELTQALCQKSGFRSYEISNFARNGQESKHNQIYWRSGDYLGIGPGAHGRVTVNGKRIATQQVSSPFKWLRDLRALTDKSLSAEDHAHEFTLMGLRTLEGIDLGRLKSLTGFAFEADQINQLLDSGMISIKDQQLCLTTKGRPLTNAILLKLFS